jgi:hypothetical protein
MLFSPMTELVTNPKPAVIPVIASIVPPKARPNFVPEAASVRIPVEARVEDAAMLSSAGAAVRAVRATFVVAAAAALAAEEASSVLRTSCELAIPIVPMD